MTLGVGADLGKESVKAGSRFVPVGLSACAQFKEKTLTRPETLTE